VSKIRGQASVGRSKQHSKASSPIGRQRYDQPGSIASKAVTRADDIVGTHNAATTWFHEELGESWEVVAQYLGDKPTTVLSHYVRAGEDALRDSASKLAEL